MPTAEDYLRVRRGTEALLSGLEPEDCVVQSMPDVSPPKWHIAHVTWFFETFVLEPHAATYRVFRPVFRELFNSYYQGIGAQHPRAERGNLSRPTLTEVLEYRRHVDEALTRLLPTARPEAQALVLLGLHHEQQHQELFVMDVKHNFSKNPLRPAYRATPLPRSPEAVPLGWTKLDGGLATIGATGDGFSFDNERPAHRRFVEPFELADRLTTNAEWLAFMADGGYQNPALWLSDGWEWRRGQLVEAPLYWRRTSDGAWMEHTAHGELALDANAPVCHVSAFEAAAYAEWAGARLATEAEWELASRGADPTTVSWLEDGLLHPSGASSAGLCQLFGDTWEWTRNAYEPYPGFRPGEGAASEYNGKFMCNQWVLRGGCVATPRGHIRSTYRNFFYPHQRWAFTGVRLARGAR